MIKERELPFPRLQSGLPEKRARAWEVVAGSRRKWRPVARFSRPPRPTFQRRDWPAAVHPLADSRRSSASSGRVRRACVRARVPGAAPASLFSVRGGRNRKGNVESEGRPLQCRFVLREQVVRFPLSLRWA